jgi:hypothetical protein
MSTDAEDLEDDIDLETDLDTDQEDTSEHEDDLDDEGDENESSSFDIDDEDDEDSQPSENNSVIRKMRKELREAKAELNKVRASTAKAEEPIVVGERPKFEDFEYDTDKYEAALDLWHENKAKAAVQKQNAEKLIEEGMKLFNAQKSALKVQDFDKAEKRFVETLTNAQGHAILRAASDKARIVYVLGKNPATLDKLATITDPVELAAEVGRIESKVQMKSKTNNLKPDKSVRGTSATASETTDKTLARLEKKALLSGNRTELINYKRDLKRKSQK